MFFKLKPAFQSYLWGGDKLKTEYHKKTNLSPLAESWELSAREEAPSYIDGGPFDGISLAEYLKKAGPSALGEKNRNGDFPLLIKLIDAKDDLSVQVHPDTAFAARSPGEEAKTEMWVILSCEENAGLTLGLKEPQTKESLRRHINENTLKQALRFCPVQKGDAFFIPPGTIHAIGKGLVIAEIQQNSNTTYRLYDYGRKDKNGQTRPLHIEKGVAAACLFPQDSLRLTPQREEGQGFWKEQLVRCSYFKVFRYHISFKAQIPVSTDSFLSLLVTEGKLSLSLKSQQADAKKGDSFFLPAQAGLLEVKGAGEILVTSLP